MMQRNVVLVLGAGASFPYGFPLGSTIVKNILGGGINSEWVRLIQQVGIDYSRFPLLQSDLRESKMQSMDGFLEVRREYEELGKALIALLIANSEKQTDLYKIDNDEDWHQYLFNLVIRESNVTEFTRKKLSFITYNYDRSLEFFLFNAIRQQLASKKDDEAYEIFQQIDIVHLHGKIGDPAVAKGPGRAYREIKSPAELNLARSEIRIIYEDVSKDSVFARAHQLLTNAETIAFLGFSYHPTNVSRLGMKEVLTSSHKSLLGTTKGMTSGEVIVLVVPQFNFPPLVSGVSDSQFYDVTVLDFLKTPSFLFSAGVI